MPEQDRETRYFIGKGSAAAFDFAAVCAVAGRVYRKTLPSFADSCVNAAKYAWEWGSRYPDSLFKNPSDIFTGEYGDKRTSDEGFWAACELLHHDRRLHLPQCGDLCQQKASTCLRGPGVGLLGASPWRFIKATRPP
jgi:hypothetical protein